ELSDINQQIAQAFGLLFGSSRSEQPAWICPLPVKQVNLIKFGVQARIAAPQLNELTVGEFQNGSERLSSFLPVKHKGRIPLNNSQVIGEVAEVHAQTLILLSYGERA